MKQKILALAFALTLAINLSAVGGNFTTLHSFLGYPNDGFTPEAGLFLSGSNLYGTTRQGGKAGYGMVFKTDTIGSGFTNLYSFTSVSAPYPYTNNDGAVPYARLHLSGNALFGTEQWGGNSGNGTVFAVSADGTGFTNLHSFTVMPTQLGHWPETNWFLYTNSDGADPFAGMIISGDTLYGTTAVGGNFGNGGIFAIKTDGSDFTNLYSFTAVFGSNYTNADGSFPQASLILSGNTLYGTTAYGGRSGNGTVFAINTDGTSFTNLHSFIYSDGANPFAGLVMSGSTLYGTTLFGGSYGNGTVFKINIAGSDFKDLHAFAAAFGAAYTNTDGTYPHASLMLSGNVLYGTAMYGGSLGQGTLFAVNTDGSSFTNLYSFSATFTNSYGVYTNSDGACPQSELVLSDAALYGTTQNGGSFSGGTVFALGLSPSAPSVVSQPQSQTAFAGRNVSFSVVARGVPSPDYQWQFNGQKLAGQTAASLSLTNVQFANAGGYLVIVTNNYGSVTSAVAQLTVFTNLVVVQTNKAPPPPGKTTIPTDATHFKVFTNGVFVSGIGLDRSKSTIVLTHGWNDSSTIWPLEMANFIKVELGASTPNMVAWDWTAAAASPLPAATLDTQGQGYGLGENLTNALGANYSQRIHFIGHSLGTLVNAKAANFIHTNGFSWSNTQMTLFDEAEVAWGMVGNSWATLTSLLENDSSPQQDWKHPLPDQCAWADNYITAFGMPHPQAVNVILTNLAPDLSNIQNLFDFGIGAWTGQFQTEITDYHHYPYIWYGNTVNQINNPNDPPYLMGFVRSWEGGGYAG